jgi:hypothetical protein
MPRFHLRRGPASFSPVDVAMAVGVEADEVVVAPVVPSAGCRSFRQDLGKWTMDGK